MISSRHGTEETGGERAREALRHEEFVRKVQRRSELATPAAAVLAIEATLAALGERVRAEANGLASVGEGEMDPELLPELASLLPGRLGEALLESSAGTADHGEGEESSLTEFSLTEFFERVGAATGVGLAEAERHACAVALTLEEAVGDGGLNGVLSRLPDEYEFLLV